MSASHSITGDNAFGYLVTRAHHRVAAVALAGRECPHDHEAVDIAVLRLVEVAPRRVEDAIADRPSGQLLLLLQLSRGAVHPQREGAVLPYHAVGVRPVGGRDELLDAELERGVLQQLIGQLRLAHRCRRGIRSFQLRQHGRQVQPPRGVEVVDLLIGQLHLNILIGQLHLLSRPFQASKTLQYDK